MDDNTMRRSISVLMVGLLAVGLMATFAGPVAADPGEESETEYDVTAILTEAQNNNTIEDDDTFNQTQIQYNDQEAAAGALEGDASVEQTNDQEADQSIEDTNEVDQEQDFEWDW